jgi:class 3 adenylate cyclase/predicted aspartyl protease
MPSAKRPKLGAAAAEYIFLDIVRYSERTIEAQTAIIGCLNRIVRASIRACGLSADKVIYIPTGDGICVALLDVSDPPDIQIKVALQILERLYQHNKGTPDNELVFQVRVGINSNRDNVVIDINGRPNLSGDGINMCARIMNKADGGQILVGEPVFGILRKRKEYVSAFKQHPAIGVKHGVLLNMYQLVREGLPFLDVAVPSAFRSLTEATAQRAPHGLAKRDLKVRGLRINVEIGPSNAEIQWAKLANVELRKPLKVRALIDTGASVTVINPQVAVTCGLRQVGQVAISSTGMVAEWPEYVGSIGFPDLTLKSRDPVRLIACPLPGQDFSCLIGRDVLDGWRLVYDGKTGEVQIRD